MIVTILWWVGVVVVGLALSTVPLYFADLGRRVREHDRTGVLPPRRW